MKNDSTVTFLNFVLAALVILGVLFALLNIWRVRDLRHLQDQVLFQQQGLQLDALKIQALINDTVAYNAKVNSPELTQILQSIQPPTPAKQ